MFNAPFSFEGRIRRTEYGLSIIIYIVLLYGIEFLMLAMFTGSTGTGSLGDGTGIVFLVLFIPLIWFIWAQGAKRCHDLGKSGWWQIIPFYGLWLLFADSQPGPNEYGDNPKGIGNEVTWDNI